MVMKVRGRLRRGKRGRAHRDAGELLALLDKPDGSTLLGAAGAFEKMAPFLKANTQYCGNFTAAQARLAKLPSPKGGAPRLHAALRDAERSCDTLLASLRFDS